MRLGVFLALVDIAVRLAKLENKEPLVVHVIMEKWDVLNRFHDCAFDASFIHQQRLRLIGYSIIFIVIGGASSCIYLPLVA